MKNKFFVKMSRHSYTLLKYQVDFNQLTLIMHIMNLNIYFQISSEADLVLTLAYMKVSCSTMGMLLRP